MTERAITRGPRRWEGIAGVIYPKEAPPTTAKPRTPWGQEKMPDAKDWCSTSAAAEALHITSAAARLKLHRAGVASCRARGGLYWARAAVADLAAKRNTEDLPPAVWMSEDAACAALKVSRSMLYRLKKKGRIRHRRCYRSARERVLLHRDDIATLSSLLQQERAIAAALSEWR